MHDPLSALFSLLALRSAASGRFEAGGAWALRFPARNRIRFGALLRGHCWLTYPGAAPLRLEQGDAFLLTNAPAYLLSSEACADAAGTDVDFSAALSADPASGTLRFGGDETVLIGGGFVVETGNAQLLLDALPSFVHIPQRDPAAAVLGHTLRLLDDELRRGQIGAALMASRLADILLVQALRAHVAAHGADSTGWLGAVNDPKIGRALGRLHGAVAHPWQVAELAAIAGMSRSAFALRFRQLAGVPPLVYLTRWRMNLARAALRRGGITLATLAAQLGYGSESAFAYAFRRHFGAAPKRYAAGDAASRPAVPGGPLPGPDRDRD
jgi:AraC-like DNA-binding protein